MGKPCQVPCTTTMVQLMVLPSRRSMRTKKLKMGAAMARLQLKAIHTTMASVNTRVIVTLRASNSSKRNSISFVSERAQEVNPATHIRPGSWLEITEIMRTKTQMDKLR